MEVMISSVEYETRFTPFVKLRILVCKNKECGNIFSLAENEILQLVKKSLTTYRLMLSRNLLVECPLCHCRQALLAKDIIGEYLQISKTERPTPTA
jgi:hypothetical protein